MLSGRTRLLSLIAVASFFGAGCAGSSRGRPSFPLFSGTPPRVHAVIAVVDSLDGRAFGSARVLSTFYGKPVTRISFCLNEGLGGCGLLWDVVSLRVGFEHYTRQGKRWFAFGDTIIAIVADPESGRPCSELGFVRWFRWTNDRVARSLFYVRAFDPRPLGTLCDENPLASWEARYAAILRVWAPDGRTYPELRAQIVDFYLHRWRESWLQRGYPNPWAPKRPIPTGETEQ